MPGKQGPIIPLWVWALLDAITNVNQPGPPTCSTPPSPNGRQGFDRIRRELDDGTGRPADISAPECGRMIAEHALRNLLEPDDAG
jgi:hypothetical protein